MIDVNLNNLRILPANHKVFENIDFIEAAQKENKDLRNVILFLLGIGGIMLIFQIKESYENKK